MDVENYSDLPQLSYTVVHVKLSPLYNMCKNYYLEDVKNTLTYAGRQYLKTDSDSWNTNEVYQLSDAEIGPLNCYLLCYEDVIVEIEFNWELTDSQKHIVNTKLNR